MLAIHCLVSGQNRMVFSNIQLGTEYKVFIKELKHRGFKIHLERNCDDDSIYSNCIECFLTGEIDGNAAVVHIVASQKTHSVFDVTTILREFIDQEEAMEEANRILPQIRDEYQLVESKVYGQDVTIVEMPGGKRHITNYVCYKVAELCMWCYENEHKLEKKENLGSICIKVCQNTLGGEHIVVIDYHDVAAAGHIED